MGTRKWALPMLLLLTHRRVLRGWSAALRQRLVHQVLLQVLGARQGRHETAPLPEGHPNVGSTREHSSYNTLFRNENGVSKIGAIQKWLPLKRFLVN